MGETADRRENMVMICMTHPSYLMLFTFEGTSILFTSLLRFDLFNGAFSFALVKEVQVYKFETY